MVILFIKGEKGNPSVHNRPLAKVGRLKAQGKKQSWSHALELSRFQRNIHGTVFKLGIDV
jgi:hypothetical protein